MKKGATVAYCSREAAVAALRRFFEFRNNRAAVDRDDARKMKDMMAAAHAAADFLGRPTVACCSRAAAVASVRRFFELGNNRAAFDRDDARKMIRYLEAIAVLDDDLTRVISSAAKGDGAAQDVLVERGRMFIEDGKPLPPELARYLIDVATLANRRQFLPRRKARDRVFNARNVFIVEMVHCLVSREGFPATSKDGHDDNCACAIVVDGINQAGLKNESRPFTPNGVAKLWAKRESIPGAYTRTLGLPAARRRSF